MATNRQASTATNQVAMPVSFTAPHLNMNPATTVNATKGNHQEWHYDAVAEADWNNVTKNAILPQGNDSYARKPACIQNQGLEVFTNYFGVDLDTSKKLWLYDVIGIDDRATRPKKRVLMEAFIYKAPLLWQQRQSFATDYQKKIVSTVDLSQFDKHLNGEAGDNDPLVDIAVDDWDARTPNNQNGPNQLQLQLQQTRVISYDDYDNFARGAKPDWNDTDGVIDALNMIISKGISDQSSNAIIPLSTSKFFMKSGHASLGMDNKVAIRGYNFTMAAGTGCPLLNFNSKISVFHEPMTVAQYLANAHGQALHQLKEDLHGVRVWVTFQRVKAGCVDQALDQTGRRTKTIAAIGNLAANQQHAYTDNGENFTVWQHMSRTYGNRTQGSAQSRCVNVGSATQAIWFLAEDLHILPYQPKGGKITGPLTSRMITQACRKPQVNFDAIVAEGIPTAGLQDDTNLPRILTDAGITIYSEKMTVPARQLNVAKIKYRDAFTDLDGSGMWRLANQPFLQTENRFNGGVYFLFSPDCVEDQATTDDYLGFFFQHCTWNGVGGLNGFNGVNAYNSTNMPGLTVTDFDGAVVAAKNSGAGLVILILPDNNKTNLKFYANFKIAVDQIHGMKSLCLCEKKIMSQNLRPMPQRVTDHDRFAGYARNVGMKLNLRLGNKNHSVMPDEIQKCMTGNANKNKPFMLLGADVVHPSGGCIDGTPSIAAVVGSIDQDFGKFRGSARRQAPRAEIIADMEIMVLERLRAYKSANNGRIPGHIMYYRDGVGTSQYEAVHAHEIRAIKNAWKTAAGADPPAAGLKLTTIIVTKRHNTRLYPHDPKDQTQAIMGGNGNVKPGTVVDSGITHPYAFDFFLQSHNSLKGTGKPAHYFVLEDQIGFSAYGLANFTNLLCHTYARSTTAVSYAPPAYYADHLCERARQYLRPFFDGENYLKDPHMNNQQRQAEMDRMWNCSGRQGGGNPWHVSLDDTMFWM